jgi:uncharacterized protein
VAQMSPVNEHLRVACVQREVVEFLADATSYAGVDRVERFETHGNLVFLAGSEAWKIKRAVRFPYMDFSTLEKRHAACLREVEINRQFAPALYLGCVPIARSPAGKLAFGSAGSIVEWAVHMRRFEQVALLSNIARTNGVPDDLARQLADTVFACHETAKRATPASGIAPMRKLAHSLAGSLGKADAFPADEVALLQGHIAQHLSRSAAILDERAVNGFVRRCHGDLHLANIVMWQGRPVAYDAIEFDEALATIDTFYDLAFLLMDLDRHAQRPAANLVLNHYLWRGRNDLDLKGLVGLPLFLALRALVRAVVSIDRAAQEGADARGTDMQRARGYFRAARDYAAPPTPQLIVIGGLSGTGKSTLAAMLAPWVGGTPGAIHLRSDLERKALAGVGEFDRLPASAYTDAARRRVYGVLRERAGVVLAAGSSVIVDAVLAEQEQRQDIEAVAAELGVPCRRIWLKAEPKQLIARVAERRNDASDATPDIVLAQVQSDTGSPSAGWSVIDAGGTAFATLERARAVLGISMPMHRFEKPT